MGVKRLCGFTKEGTKGDRPKRKPTDHLEPIPEGTPLGWFVIWNSDEGVTSYERAWTLARAREIKREVAERDGYVAHIYRIHSGRRAY